MNTPPIRPSSRSSVSHHPSNPCTIPRIAWTLPGGALGSKFVNSGAAAALVASRGAVTMPGRKRAGRGAMRSIATAAGTLVLAAPTPTQAQSGGCPSCVTQIRTTPVTFYKLYCTHKEISTRYNLRVDNRYHRYSTGSRSLRASALPIGSLEPSLPFSHALAFSELDAVE